jgi:hypothetical protein
MSNSSGNFFAKLIGILASLFGKKTPAPAPVQPAPIPDSPDEPAPIAISKVLSLVYDPTMDGGRKLSTTMGWHRPEDLTTGAMDDILQTSHGQARYQIVQRVELDEFPAKVDGYRYTPQEYMDVLRGAAQPHQPAGVDYNAILERFDLLKQIGRGEIDEVWIFAFPHAGLYESTMGGAGAFWCNAPPIKNTSQCARRFVVMGFNFERYIGEMLEAFGHRAESIMVKTFEKLTGDANLWQRFIRCEQSAPGKAACGNVHFAPNSERDYDWNNPRTVSSECYDWLLNFPDFKGDIRNVAASEWGSGDIRLHHQWWFKHFPHVAGRRNGICNCWWQYIINPNKVNV